MENKTKKMLIAELKSFNGVKNDFIPLLNESLRLLRYNIGDLAHAMEMATSSLKSLLSDSEEVSVEPMVMCLISLLRDSTYEI